MLKIGCAIAIVNRGSSACTCTYTLEVHVECACVHPTTLQSRDIVGQNAQKPRPRNIGHAEGHVHVL